MKPMRRQLAGWMSLGLLAACHQAPVVQSVAPARHSAAPVDAAATATPAPAASRVLPVAGQKLVPPPGDHLQLVGTIALDPNYLVSEGAASLVAVGGAPLVAAGLARLDAGGQTLLGANGKAIASRTDNLIAAPGQGVLGPDGTLISDNGAGLLSNNGGSLISNNGGALVANNAGNLTAKTKYRLQDAATPGTLRSAAGMAVGLRSLRTGLPVPVGVDASGTPVYTVYSNLQGGYTLYPPASEAGNVLVVAGVPASSDARAQLSAIAGATADTGGAVDEDTDLVTRSMRGVFAGHLASIFTRDPAYTACLLSHANGSAGASADFLLAVVKDLHDQAVAASVSSDPAQGVALRVLAQRCADAVMASVDIGSVVVQGNGTSDENAPDTVGHQAMEVVIRSIKAAREASAGKLASAPAFFEQQPYFQIANQCDPGRYVIRKPSDALAFVIDDYLVTDSDPGLYWTANAFASVGLPAGPTGEPYAAVSLARAMDALQAAFTLSYVANAHGEKDAIAAFMKAYDPAHPDLAGEAAPLPFRAPCPRPSVQTNFSACDPGATSP